MILNSLRIGNIVKNEVLPIRSEMSEFDIFLRDHLKAGFTEFEAKKLFEKLKTREKSDDNIHEIESNVEIETRQEKSDDNIHEIESNVEIETRQEKSNFTIVDGFKVCSCGGRTKNGKTCPFCKNDLRTKKDFIKEINTELDRLRQEKRYNQIKFNQRYPSFSSEKDYDLREYHPNESEVLHKHGPWYDEKSTNYKLMDSDDWKTIDPKKYKNENLTKEEKERAKKAREFLLDS